MTHRIAPGVSSWFYRGRHAERLSLGDCAFWVFAVVVAGCVGSMLAPKMADAYPIPDRPARVTVQPDSAPVDVMPTAQAWARLMENRDYAGQYDLWTAEARATVPKADYLRAVRCDAPQGEPFIVRNLRIDQVRVSGNSAIVWYWGESFRSLGPLRFKASTWHLYHVLAFEAGAWRHRPLHSVTGSLAAHLEARAAPCRPTHQRALAPQHP